jgi:phosphatidylinositol glycan class K
MVKDMGIPDSQIILMLADDIPCNARNHKPGQMYDNQFMTKDLYQDVEVDYRGSEVTVESFLRLLTGRHSDDQARSKRLLTDENSNILIYMNGHGGNGFIKFQDVEELSSADLADTLEQMHKQKRYNEILLYTDTCQAASLGMKVYSPNVLSVGSSLIGENSYSGAFLLDVQNHVADRMTQTTRDFAEVYQQDLASNPNTKTPSLQDLLDSLSYDKLHSHIGITNTLSRPTRSIPFTDFFGSVAKVYKAAPAYPLSNVLSPNSNYTDSNSVHRIQNSAQSGGGHEDKIMDDDADKNNVDRKKFDANNVDTYNVAENSKSKHALQSLQNQSISSTSQSSSSFDASIVFDQIMMILIALPDYILISSVVAFVATLIISDFLNVHESSSA